MKDWFNKNWYWVLAGIVGFIVLVWIYKSIKKSGAKPHQVKIGSDTVGDEIPQEEITRLTSLAENLHEDIHCIACFRDTPLYDELSKLGNNYLVALSNIYNQIYELDDNETFYQALNRETYWGNTDGKVEAVKDRLRSLGVS